MKKLSILLLSGFILSACGEEKAEAPKEEESVEETAPAKVEDTELAEEVEPAEEDSASAIEPIELEEGTMQPLSYFGTEESYTNFSETGEGLINVDFEGFTVDSQFLLADFTPNEEYAYLFESEDPMRAIMVLMQAENTTDKEVDYNGDLMIVTDTKEQVNGDAGVMSSNAAVQTYYGQVQEIGYYIIPLKKDSMPKKLTVHMGAPYEVVDGAVDPENGMLGEDQEFELSAYEIKE